MNLSGRTVPRKTAERLKQIYPKPEARRRIMLLGKKRCRILCAIAVITAAGSVPVFISDAKRQSDPVAALERNEYGGGERTVSLKAVTEDGQEEKISVKVGERKYTDTELETFSCELDSVLWDGMLADNSGSGSVMYDLRFADHVDGYPFSITWKTDRPLLLNSKGEINTERLQELDPEDNGVIVQIRAAISYGDYSEDKYSSVVLKRRIKNRKEAVREAVETSIKETDEMSRAERIQILPDSAGGWEVTFYDASVNRGWAVLLMGGAGAVLALAADERKIRDMCDERKKQMDIDHPGILNQYMLYFAAGMNTRAIWYSMCRRYEESLDPSGRNRRYAYDEMVSARNRMDEGCGEIEAYEEFAKRCDMKYRSFISLIKQAALKGNGSLSEQLYEEMEKALREKNNRVKTEASEAETKLLLPMFMMLAVVLAIVMIPAFIGLNG